MTLVSVLGDEVSVPLLDRRINLVCDVVESRTKPELEFKFTYMQCWISLVDPIGKITNFSFHLDVRFLKRSLIIYILRS